MDVRSQTLYIVVVNTKTENYTPSLASYTITLRIAGLLALNRGGEGALLRPAAENHLDPP